MVFALDDYTYLLFRYLISMFCEFLYRFAVHVPIPSRHVNARVCKPLLVNLPGLYSRMVITLL